MRPISLYLLSSAKDPRTFALYERHLSGREEIKQTNVREQESLRGLVEALQSGDTPVPPVYLSGFYYSYTIRHISKEFDLLKFPGDGTKVLNIELKSEDIGRDRIREQLLQNRYYLGHLAGTILSYTYVSSTGTLYMLNAHNYLVTCPISDLQKLLTGPDFLRVRRGDIDRWFDAVYYLISPIATPERFLRRNYFLTNQQHDFRKKILKKIWSGRRPCMIGIGGGAGTGKTLLLYDLALVLSRRRKVVIVHCGVLSQGHRIIDRKLRNVSIVTPEETIQEDFDYLLVDEAGRLAPQDFERMTALVREKKLACIFCFDSGRFRFADADRKKLREKMDACMDLFLELSGNIRINRDLAAFTRRFFDLYDEPAQTDFSSISIRCAHGEQEKQILLEAFREQGYVVLSGAETEEAGTETDCVLVVLDEGVFYDEEGVLHAGREEEEDLAGLCRLYDAISRAREKLCLLVCDNDALFSALLALVAAGSGRKERT